MKPAVSSTLHKKRTDNLVKFRGMQHLKTGFAALSASLVLSACSLFSSHPSAPAPAPQGFNDWPTLQSQLNELHSWELFGKLGVRSPSNNFTAAINRWTQVDDLFNIDLSSTFFGLGASNISGNAHAVILTEGDEAPVYSDNPNALIESELGIALPITYLTFWIKGLPLPSAPSEIEFDNRGTPTQIKQLGWTISLSKHSWQHGLPLPGKIKFLHDSTTITMAIKQWTLI